MATAGPTLVAMPLKITSGLAMHVRSQFDVNLRKVLRHRHMRKILFTYSAAIWLSCIHRLSIGQLHE